MDGVAEFPADDLVAEEVELQRVVPERQNALLETGAQNDVAHVLLFSRALDVVDGFDQAGVLKATKDQRVSR